MALKSIYSKPGHLIRRAQQIAVALFMEETAEFDLTPVQYAALRAVAENSDIDVTRLSYMIAFDRSTLGNVVERLEKKGWLERRSGKIDKRIKLLRITPAGRKLLKDVEPLVELVQQKILVPIPKAERSNFIRLLKLLVDLNNSHSRAPLRAAEKE